MLILLITTIYWTVKAMSFFKILLLSTFLTVTYGVEEGLESSKALPSTKVFNCIQLPEELNGHFSSFVQTLQGNSPEASVLISEIICLHGELSVVLIDQETDASWCANSRTIFLSRRCKGTYDLAKKFLFEMCNAANQTLYLPEVISTDENHFALFTEYAEYSTYVRCNKIMTEYLINIKDNQLGAMLIDTYNKKRHCVSSEISHWTNIYKWSLPASSKDDGILCLLGTTFENFDHLWKYANEMGFFTLTQSHTDGYRIHFRNYRGAMLALLREPQTASEWSVLIGGISAISFMKQTEEARLLSDKATTDKAQHKNSGLHTYRGPLTILSRL